MYFKTEAYIQQSTAKLGIKRYPGGGKDLSDTLQEALRQIGEKEYQANLVAKGIPIERIRKYGFAFCGKKVLIGGAMQG